MSANAQVLPASNPTGLALFLHGVGASGASLRPLTRMVAQEFPNLAVHAPNAPQKFDQGPGYQWFSIADVTESNRKSRVEAAMPAFRAVIAREAQSYNVPLDRVMLIGFSQGAIMAMHHVIDGGLAGGVIAMSGRLADAPTSDLSNAPVVRLIHGEDDPIMPIETAVQTKTWLRVKSADVTMDRLSNLGHEIDRRVAKLVLKSVAEFSGAFEAEGV